MDTTAHFSFDVEADGPAPALYSMVSIGIVRVDDFTQSFYATLRPISDAFVPAALAVSGFSREECMAFEDPASVMLRLQQWVAAQTRQRAVMWSDNPGFDWQFLNYYCHRYLQANPFGHSCRRIGDLYAGLQGDPRQTREWRRWRGEPHTHNALDDARGNARALARMLADASARQAARPAGKSA